VVKVSSQLPADVVLALEPTDRDIDKFFLFGPLGDTVSFVKRLQNDNVNIGLLLDMCHVPIMHETLESALEISKDVLCHIHLGNCVIQDETDMYYGDKHPSWDYPGGEYSSEDGKKFINMLKSIGYFDKENATLSFEMRPFESLNPEESLKKFVEVFKSSDAFC
jgi:sugar phosphate isomerase/epimerase